MVILGAFALFEVEPSAGWGRGLSVLRPQGTFQREGSALYFIYCGGYTTVLTYHPIGLNRVQFPEYKVCFNRSDLNF